LWHFDTPFFRIHPSSCRAVMPMIVARRRQAASRGQGNVYTQRLNRRDG